MILVYIIIFLVVPEEDEARLLDAARFMDSNECNTVIAAARSSQGLPFDEVVARLEAHGLPYGVLRDLRAGRSLIVNGQLFRERDRLTQDLSLEEIKLKAAVFSFRGYRFEVLF